MKDNLRIYGVKDSYIRYLSQYQEHLFRHEGVASGRKYIGVVFEINRFSYFAPLSSFKPKHKKMKEGVDFIKIKDYAVININNMLAIQYARENRVPALGTCAGFQHMVIEFARNVLGLYSADSEENDTECADAVIVKLSCTLMNKKEQLEISDSNSILARTVGRNELIGEYRCNYGFNEAYRSVFQNSDMITDVVETKNGYFRGFELKDHPFFIGTLFIPQLDFRGNSSYRIIKSFLKVVLDI